MNSCSIERKNLHYKPLYNVNCSEKWGKQACRPWVCGVCHGTPPDFGRSVNPISTWGDRLCPPNYYWHTRNFKPSDGPANQRSSQFWARRKTALKRQCKLWIPYYVLRKQVKAHSSIAMASVMTPRFLRQIATVTTKF